MKRKTDTHILAFIVLAVLAGAVALGGRWMRINMTPGTDAPEPGVDPADAGRDAALGASVVEGGWPVACRLPALIDPIYNRVVLVTIDTLRADHVSSYGYRRPTTPFFDSLAERGVLLENTVSSVSHTAPSHASMLTGLPPEVHGVLQNFNKLDPDAVELGGVYRRAGFETAAVLSVKFLRGITNGFEFVDVQPWSGKPVIDSAVAWLRTKRSSDRFFLWVHLYDPHRWKERGKTPRDELAAIQAGTDMDQDELYSYLADLHGLPPVEADGSVDLGWRVEIKGKGLIRADTVADYLELIDSYDAQTLFADRLLQRLYHEVEDLDLLGPTLWVVTSDHGEGLASHGVAGHGGRIYQEQLRVPLLFHATDGSLGPRRVPELVQLVDLFPTLSHVLDAELGGLDPFLYGASLWPLLRDEPGWIDRPAFSQRRPPEEAEPSAKTPNRRVRPGPEQREPDSLSAMQSDRFKLILYEPGDDEFFDLDEDPLERVNLISEETKELAALRKLLEERLRIYRTKKRTVSDEEISDEILEELRALGYVE